MSSLSPTPTPLGTWAPSRRPCCSCAAFVDSEWFRVEHLSECCIAEAASLRHSLLPILHPPVVHLHLLAVPDLPPFTGPGALISENTDLLTGERRDRGSAGELRPRDHVRAVLQRRAGARPEARPHRLPRHVAGASVVLGFSHATGRRGVPACGGVRASGLGLRWPAAGCPACTWPELRCRAAKGVQLAPRRNLACVGILCRDSATFTPCVWIARRCTRETTWRPQRSACWASARGAARARRWWWSASQSWRRQSSWRCWRPPRQRLQRRARLARRTVLMQRQPGRPQSLRWVMGPAM